MPVLSDEELNRIAKEGDALNRVNTILGRNPMPGVGAPGSTPQTDAGNVSMANSMERSDRGGRFGFGSQEYLQNTDTPEVPETVDPGGIDIGLVNDRRNKILQGVDPDAPAIYPNARRKIEMQHELGTLTNIAHEHALTTAKGAHETYKQQKDIEAATEFAGLVNGLAGLKTKPGTPEHATELLGLVSQYPLGSRSPAALALIKTHASTHAEHKTLQESIADFTKATGAPPESIETTATGGFNLRGKAPAGKTDNIPSHTLDRYAKLQGEITQHELAAQTEAEQNTKSGIADAKYSKSAEWAAAQKELTILEKAHPILKEAAPETAKAPVDERVSVISPDGKVGHIPKSQLDAALKAGYKTK